MTRVLLLSCSFAMVAACDVGTVPGTPESDGPPPGVTCLQPGINTNGHHKQGEGCLNAGCHSPTSRMNNPNNPIDMASGGTAYETANGEGKGTASIVLTWTGGTATAITATGDAATGLGNFYFDPTEIAGITYPASVKISLCNENERPMATPIANADDLNCSRAGCHGNGTAKVYWKL